jgi:hypothetical protein
MQEPLKPEVLSLSRPCTGPAEAAEVAKRFFAASNVNPTAYIYTVCRKSKIYLTD